MQSSIYSFTVALFLTISLIPLLIKFSAKLQLLDEPDTARKVHDRVVPRSGGLAIILGVFLPLLFLLPIESKYLGLSCGAFIIAVFGYLDDRYELGYQWKFFGQILAVIAVMAGGITIGQVPLMGFDSSPSWISLPLSFFFILGAINAVNLSDGLDGLAAGTSLLALALIAVFAFQSGVADIALVALTVMGGLLGFLRFNTFPARIFMGDAGSQFLGFVLASLAIMVTQSTQSAVSVALPLLIIGLPILDTVSVMVIRIKEKRSPFSPDRNHLHHQLMSLNLKHHEAVAIIYIIQVTLMVSAYIFRYESDLFLVIYYVFFCALFLSALYMGRRKIVFFRHEKIVDESGDRRNRLLRKFSWVYFHSALIVEITISLILLVIAVFFSNATTDFSQGAILAAIVLALIFAFRGKAHGLVARICCYTASAYCIYLFTTSGINVDYHPVADGSLVALAFFLAFALRMTRKEDFRLDTQDLLIFLIVIILPQLPFDTIDSNSIGKITLRIVVLMYGCEFVVAKSAGKLTVLSISSVVSLLIVGLKPIMVN